MIRLAGGLAVGMLNVGWGAPRSGPGREVAVDPASWGGAEIDRLWERLRNAYDATVVRDRAWLAYRYADAPEREYRLLLARREGEPVGYLVYRVLSAGGRRSGWIADLFTAPYDPGAAAALVRAALAHMREAEAHDVRGFAAGGTPVYRALRSAGFLQRTGAYQVSVIPLAGPVSREILYDPTRWLFSVGDSDVV